MNKLLYKIREKELNIPILAGTLFLAVILGFLLLGNDMQMLIRWDLSLFFAGLVVLPLNKYILGDFGSKGYFFSRILGIMIISYIVWLLSRFRILPFGIISVLISAVVLTVCIYGFIIFSFLKKGTKAEDRSSYFNKYGYNLETVISSEITVLLIHVLTTWFLGLKIPGNQTERLMDVAFMITLDKTKYMSPLDVWAAGNTINYYYYGHYLMTMISKISFIDVKYGYSLALSMIMTFSIIASFILIYILINKGLRYGKAYGVIGGCISSLAVNFAGNFHYFVFYKIVPAIWDICRIPGDRVDYWFADSTRYIGYVPENAKDRTISEFPFYSYIIGDLHAHVIDIIIVMLLLAISISYYLRVKSNAFRNKGIISEKLDIAKMFNLELIVLSFALGISSMTNYWDYLIYFIVCGSVFLITNLFFISNKVYSLVVTGIQGIVAIIISKLVNYPFMSQFVKMINGISFTKYKSHLHQIIILWGIPITVVILLLIFIVADFVENTNQEKNEVGCYLLFDKLKFTDALMLIIGLCAIGLVFLPEIIFVKDIYIEGAPRANTMFKLTYQAYILFGLLIGYSLARFIRYIYCNTINGYTFLRVQLIRCYFACIILWLLTLGYPFTAVKMWMGDYKALEYLGLDSTQTILSNVPGERDAVNWINNELKGQEIILTASGSSYSDSCIISGLTGHPTVIGWITHEWLWHNNYDFVDQRQKDVFEIYSNNDVETKRKLCEKYNVDYIYVGNEEYSQFTDMELLYIQQLGDIVYYNGDYNNYIIRID